MIPGKEIIFLVEKTFFWKCHIFCVFRLFNGKSTEDLESIEENTKIKANNLDPGKKESFKEFLSASFSKNHEKKGSKVSKLHFIL